VGLVWKESGLDYRSEDLATLVLSINSNLERCVIFLEEEKDAWKLYKSQF
jgi:hypothetical protein